MLNNRPASSTLAYAFGCFAMQLPWKTAWLDDQLEFSYRFLSRKMQNETCTQHWCLAQRPLQAMDCAGAWTSVWGGNGLRCVCVYVPAFFDCLMCLLLFRYSSALITARLG